MKKLLLLAPALLLAGSFAAAEAADNGADAVRTAICHKTSSKTRPYQRIVVTSAAARRAHVAHPDDIVPAPRQCPRTSLTVASGGTPITLALHGVAEQPTLGDPRGSGTATLRLRAGQGRVCFTIRVRDIALPATGAHIHHGGVDVSGPVVLPFTSPGADGTASGCVAAGRPLVQAMLHDRTSFYLNVHTSEFPGGAVRAQLAQPASARLLVAAPLTGPNERPSPGDSDGTGSSAVLVFPDRGRLCYTVAVRDIQLPTIGAHIHRAGPDVAGPVVIPFAAPGASGTSSGCVDVDAALLGELVQTPGAFYVNIHTRDFPGGAVRAQLAS